MNDPDPDAHPRTEETWPVPPPAAPLPDEPRHPGEVAAPPAPVDAVGPTRSEPATDRAPTTPEPAAADWPDPAGRRPGNGEAGRVAWGPPLGAVPPPSPWGPGPDTPAAPPPPPLPGLDEPAPVPAGIPRHAVTTGVEPLAPTTVTGAATRLEQVLFEMRRVIVGQERVLERVLVALLAGGHCLLEGVPGLGKTLTVSTLARTLGGTFTRIQFTPDLIPADIVGTRIYRASEERFDVELGPVFANFLLADEINRAPAKVQSALLEVMAEQQVSIAGTTHDVPRPFLVLATQNPIESEGVYPLPEAQRDRFLFRIPVDYPSPAEEHEIVARAATAPATPARLLSTDDVIGLQDVAARVYVDPAVADYAVRLVLATRRPREHGLDRLEGLLAYGASPRASIGLLRAGRGIALLRGRSYVIPQDVYDVAYDVLNHRLVLSFDAVAEGVSVDDVLVAVLSEVVAPRLVPAESGW